MQTSPALCQGRARRYVHSMRRFQLVDFAAHYQKGFRNHIVQIGDVPGLVESFERYGCYATYFFFSDELLTYMSAHGAAPSVSGYEGKVWAPFLPIDLDHPELSPALEAARLLSGLFLEGWKIDPAAMQIYFSGAKGFHFMLDSRIFGRVAPSRKLPAIFDSLRRHLAQELAEPLRGTVDLSIKDRMRLLRLPNTIHEKSKLYKIVVSADELRTLDASQIRELAKEPRELTLTDESGLLMRVEVKQNPAAVKLFQRVQRQLKTLTRQPFAYRFHRPANLTQIEFPCAGAQAIWQNHIEPGVRNNCAIRLASELRLLGLSAEETGVKLMEWNERHNIELSADELRSVVHSAYQHRFPYRYGCRDQILRRFCPLRDVEACRRFAAGRAAPRRAPA
ncbi:MAG: primase C-terminal domain-containing protein [Candidatus Binatia bacterium]